MSLVYSIKRHDLNKDILYQILTLVLWNHSLAEDGNKLALIKRVSLCYGIMDM